jgi:hypothetical protein
MGGQCTLTTDILQPDDMIFATCGVDDTGKTASDCCDEFTASGDIALMDACNESQHYEYDEGEDKCELVTTMLDTNGDPIANMDPVRDTRDNSECCDAGAGAVPFDENSDLLKACETHKELRYDVHDVNDQSANECIEICSIVRAG